MKFKNIKSSDSNFYYQCGLEPLKNSNEGICSYDANSMYNEKGYYRYSDYLSLQKKFYILKLYQMKMMILCH